jgi:hypothetical protein
VAFCFGDGIDVTHTTPCPCGNFGAPGHGCAHSFDAGGALLTASGTPAADDIQLASSSEPATSFTLFLQHDALGDFVFHDGVLCAGGTLVRLRGRNAVSGAATFPNPTWDSSITLSQRGSVFPGRACGATTRPGTATPRRASARRPRPTSRTGSSSTGEPRGHARFGLAGDVMLAGHLV